MSSGSPWGMLDALQVTTTETLVFVFVALVSAFLWRGFRRPFNMPPGPWGLPFVGYIPFLTDKPHVEFDRLAKKHGDVFSLSLGNRLIVVLGSYDSIREAFVKQADNFAGRMSTPPPGKSPSMTIFTSEGELFKDYKRFTLSTLRDFGFGKLSIEPRIKEEINFLLRSIEDNQGKPTDIGDLIRMSVSNVICSIKLGHRFEYDDPKFQDISRILNLLVRGSQPVSWAHLVSWVFVIPGVKKLLGAETLMNAHGKLLELMRNTVKERRATHQDGSEHDFTAAWLTEASKRDDKEGHNFTDEHLAKVLYSLFVAGSDTTSNTIRWSLLYMMKHSEIQEKVQKEIDEIVGHERTPSLQDRDRMPYTEATLNEVQRVSTLVPLAINHTNFHATTLSGYHIPKRTIIVPNLWAVHHDPSIYPEPFEFKPERFLDADGKLMKAEKLIPFSIGKRQCLGESLARAELFLYFTSLLQRFAFKKPEGAELNFDYICAAVSLPNAYEVCSVVRQPLTTQL